MKFSKKNIRTYYLNKRMQINNKLKKNIDNKLFQLFINSPFILFKTYHFFLPINNKNEFNTYLLINFLLKKKQIVVPKVINNHLEHFIFNHNTKVKIDKWNIPNPINTQSYLSLEKIEIVIVPLLICDSKGNRIGYGKGYYDKFLSKLRKNTLKIGINFFDCITQIPKEKHDIKLNYLISPNGIRKF